MLSDGEIKVNNGFEHDAVIPPPNDSMVTNMCKSPTQPWFLGR